MDRRLLWLAIGTFAGGTEGFVIGPLLPSMAETFGVSISQAAIVVFCYSLAHGLGTPTIVSFVGGVDRRTLLASGLAIFSVATLLISTAPVFPWLVASRTILAFGAGLYTSMSFATAAAIAPPERRGRAMGLVAAGQSVAVLIGVPLGAYLSGSLGWRTIYLILAVMGAAACAAIWFNLPSGLVAADRRTLRERLATLRLPGVPVGLAATAAFMVAAYIPLVFVGPLSAAIGGLDRSLLPLVLVGNGVGAVAGTQFGGRLSDALGARPTTIAMSAILTATLLALWGIAYLPVPAHAAAYVAVMTLFGFCGWAFWPSQQSRMAGLAGDRAPLVLSLNLTAINLGVASCAAIGGLALDRLGVISLPLVAIPFAVLGLLLSLPGAVPKTAAA